MFGISPMQLLIILAIVILLFGTKKLRGIGGDLGGALKGFKKAMSDEDKDADFKKTDEKPDEKVEDKTAAAAENKVKETKSEQKESS
ncbi:twin-arginine translocase TatA/TatE family subunit [Paraglaciecola aquimarina]|uniref:Sec-independent protein translocase protein TatA n=1 Tax=Paraglaciecola aquimarina TaxID=1235557 RepID=A0ABU3SSL1_9ALTE|nr:twin-arginine translocase TatA/TatE family subunit [Paraglaciecola aquimarina]MDU0352957.1 twin-arginine translocase TatA/TatE family subunit [Paraglaciecola aquimarina]